MKLSPNQLAASTHRDGPALVIAGPGSGKTAVLTNRIKFLIEECNIPPESILVITFSKAASLEMQDRFNLLCEDSYYPVNFGTFHSIFFQIINLIYHYNASHILNLSEKRGLMRRVVKKLLIVDNPENELLDVLIKEVGYFKNCNESITINSDTNITTEQFDKVYKAYRDLQVASGKIDFEDMMLIVRNLFRKRPDILNEYKLRYRYILVDEYQDINDIQYDIIRMLTNGNLWVCGDDDQSIYGFRGSNPSIMLSFKADYPDAVVYKLSTNYRCTDKIIEMAGKVIVQNKHRYDKDIEAFNKNSDNPPVEIIEKASVNEENDYLVSEIEGSFKNLKSYSKIAVFSRTNREASMYADILRTRGIPVTMKEKAYNPYNTPTYNDFYHYISLAKDIDKLSVMHLLPILNKPSRYIRRDYITGDYITFDELFCIYKDNKSMINILKTFRYQLQKIADMDIYSSINYIRKGIMYDDYIRSNITTRDKYDDYIATADWLMENSRQFKSIDDMNEYAIHYESEEIETEEDTTQNGKVNIMTYHASKGLEFDTVILMHVNEGSVPHKKAYGEEKIEEERRLFYVAMTRAKRRLIITYVGGTKLKPSMPSRFLYGLKSKN